MSDPFYRSPGWKRLSRACLQRDDYRCSTPGCARRATQANHIKARKDGGADALHNLESKCWPCHSRRTALHDGGFGNAPSRKRAVGADGWPADERPPGQRLH